jgi:hypothetical protein
MINLQRLDFNSKELEYSSQIESLQTKLEDKNSNYQLIFNKFELLEKEMLELVIYFLFNNEEIQRIF